MLPSAADPRREARIAALIDTLHDVEQQLQALTADEIDTVASRAGSKRLLAARNPSVAAALRAEQASIRSAELLQAVAEQALRDSKAMLDMAGRSAKVGGWTFDVAQRRLHWSDMVAGLHDEPAGYSPSMEQGLAAFVPEHRAAVQAAVQRCIASGTPYDLEAEKVSATGRRFWVRTIGEAVRDAEGRIVRIQGALQDITERKLAALETQKLAQRLSNTLESISDAFFTVDRDWRFTSTLGISFIRSTWKSWKFDCSTRPSFKVIALCRAAARAKPIPPSICALITSGLMAMPQSTAHTTRSKR